MSIASLLYSALADCRSSWTPARSELHAASRGLALDDVTDGTRAVASKLQPREGLERPLLTPIYHCSTYRVPSVGYYEEACRSGYTYQRGGNPTVEAAEAAISALQGGAATLVFGSGSSAIATTLMAFLESGDHVVASRSMYSGAYKILNNYLTKFNIKVTWISGVSTEDYRTVVQANTKVLYAETPCNPTLGILDLAAFARLGQGLEGVVTMVDSTFASPYVLKPLQYGVDMDIHSCSKFLGGHNDLVAGSVSCRTLEHCQRIRPWRTTIGTVLSPYDGAALLRGIKTLHVRMERICENAARCAAYLESHEKVERVHYPGLPSHPHYLLATSQMKKFGGLVVFDMKGGFQAARAVAEGTRLIVLAVSLGGTETLIEHTAGMTHGASVMTSAEREAVGVTEGMLRISFGIEDVDDLLTDLQQALDKA